MSKGKEPRSAAKVPKYRSVERKWDFIDSEDVGLEAAPPPWDTDSAQVLFNSLFKVLCKES